MASVSKRPWTSPSGERKEAWIVRFVDHGGSHRQRTFQKKKEADAFRSKIETELRNGMFAADADKVTVAVAVKQFLQHMHDRRVAGQIGLSHYIKIETHLRVHVVPFLSNSKLSEINLAMLTDWHRRMRDARPLSTATAKYIAQSLKMVFDFAMRREWVHRNPTTLLLADLRGGEVGRVRTFTIDELRAVLSAANIKVYRGVRPAAHLRLQCAVHLAAFCGLRLGEIFGLRVGDIDFDAAVIRLRSSLSRRDGLKGPKSRAGNRDVALPSHVAALLFGWIERHQRPNAGGLMFCGEGGKPISMDGFRNSTWGALLERAGLPRLGKRPAFRFHALRHFAASWMIDNGWSLPEVAATLGHAKVDVTLGVYAHALQNRSASVAEMQALSDRLMQPRLPA